jgi:hypothetical protein
MAHQKRQKCKRARQMQRQRSTNQLGKSGPPPPTCFISKSADQLNENEIERERELKMLSLPPLASSELHIVKKMCLFCGPRDTNHKFSPPLIQHKKRLF